ncbi:DUF6083 domain-containing protein [Streptomyces triticagri]|uniref:DUF6083 domain-containing protein n=1 Tax=Streptomyces triticagri TaxID=2293568 RepID=UPI0026BAC1EE
MTGPAADSPDGQARVRQGRCRFERCPACGTPTHVHPGIDGREIALQPGNHPAGLLPPRNLRHLSHGIVYPGADPREYGTARIEHVSICLSLPRPAHPVLAELWRALSLRAACERNANRR